MRIGEAPGLEIDKHVTSDFQTITIVPSKNKESDNHLSDEKTLTVASIELALIEVAGRLKSL
ncbi:MAG: hypothetical protein WA374_02025 [Acidobacteriaceae bacterium]|jgi:hypothetical protein